LGEEDSIMSASADGNRVVKLVTGCCGAWTPDGRYYLFSESNSNVRSDLWALPERRGFFSPGREPAPAQLTAGPLDFRFPLPARFSNTVFAVGTEYHAELVRYDRGRGEFTPYMHGISAVGLAFSPDGQWVAYATFPDRVLWRSRVDGKEALQLTSPPMRAYMPRWSPDGKQIVFSGDAPGQTMNIFVVSAAGGAAEHLVPSNQIQLDPDWSPDGKSLVFDTFLPNLSIYILDLSSRRVSTLPGSSGLFSPHWSPDGRYISGTEWPSENLMLFDTRTQTWTKPCDCAVSWPLWSHDGKYLYFKRGKMGSPIDRLRVSDRRIETVVDASKAGRWTAGPNTGGWFGLAPPDDSPMVARDISTQEIYALEMQWP
jgi:Tol biopolymer transport system component